MPPARSLAPIPEALRAFVLERQAARVDLGSNAAPFLAALSRTAIELAVAADGAAVVVTRRAEAGAAVRGARALGAEPRVAGARLPAGLGVRAPLSLPLQAPRADPSFASAAAFVGDFAAVRAAAGGSTATTVSGKVQTALGRARDAALAAFDFESARAPVEAAFGASDPARRAAGAAMKALARAEDAARALGSPAPWSALAGPSPRGRRPAVFVDLSALAPSDAEDVLGLTLASLASARAAGEGGLAQTPLVVVCDEPKGDLGRFASQRLAAPPAAPSAPVLVLLAADGPPPPDGPFALSAWDGAALRLPSGALLPLSPAPEPSDPLTEAEVRALTPPSLRARIMGGPPQGGDAEDAAPAGEGSAPAPRAAESLQALRAAAGDIEALARAGARAADRPRPRKGADYEASDFEL
jgi:hypothetical protein